MSLQMILNINNFTMFYENIARPELMYAIKLFKPSLTLSLQTSPISDVIADCQRRRLATLTPSRNLI